MCLHISMATWTWKGWITGVAVSHKHFSSNLLLVLSCTHNACTHRKWWNCRDINVFISYLRFILFSNGITSYGSLCKSFARSYEPRLRIKLCACTVAHTPFYLSIFYYFLQDLLAEKLAVDMLWRGVWGLVKKNSVPWFCVHAHRHTHKIMELGIVEYVHLLCDFFELIAHILAKCLYIIRIMIQFFFLL